MGRTIQVVSTETRAGLYVDGELAFEDRTLSAYQVLRALDDADCLDSDVYLKDTLYTDLPEGEVRLPDWIMDLDREVEG
jgi:hypothetical protein